MDPISLIVSALAAGAAAAGKGVAESAVKDAYAGLKTLLVRKFGAKAAVAEAVAGVEARPQSESRQGVLKEELEMAGAESDPEVLTQAQTLLELLQALPGGGASYSATAGAGGVIAQGPGAVAGGTGSTVVGGDVHGGIHTGGGSASPSSPPTPIAKRQALEEARDVQKALLQVLKKRLILAAGGEAAKIEVQIEQTGDAIAELEGRLDELAGA